MTLLRPPNVEALEDKTMKEGGIVREREREVPSSATSQGADVKKLCHVKKRYLSS